MNHVLVSDIMTRQLISVEPDTNLLDCAKKLVRKKVGSLLLLEGKKLKGFISTQDILWAIVKKSSYDLTKIRALDISPRKIVTIKPEATLEEAIKKIKRFKFHKIPVVKNKEVVGLIALRDIVSFYPEMNAHFREVEEIKEETDKIKRLEGTQEKAAARDGICEECGSRGQLYRFNGMLVCSSCMSSD
jgi:CBS domain-containing protein